jgi:8-oxo-dGTP pyrophosphatase MutT (NUDIX family)
VLPRIPASAGALIGDGRGHFLIVKPTYKSGWNLPGGQIESDGESPWDACRREVAEETSLVVVTGRLVCVDFLRPRSHRPGGLRFVFDCGDVGPVAQEGIVLQAEEIEDHRWVGPAEADHLLRGPVGRRVAHILADGSGTTLYLEDGRMPVGVTRP